MEWHVAVAIIALAATAAFIQALSGFGFALFIVPFLALLIGPKDTVLLSNLLSTFSGAVQAANLRHSADRRTAGVLMTGSFLGMPLGLAVLLLLEPRALQFVIAVMVIVVTLLLMRGFALHAAGRLGDLVTGFVSGVLNTSTSMSGPPVVVYLQGKGMAPQQFRATIAMYFFVTSAIGVALLLVSGGGKASIFLAFAFAVPAVLAGQKLGNVLFTRIDAEFFRRMVYVILLISAAVAIAGAARG